MEEGERQIDYIRLVGERAAAQTRNSSAAAERRCQKAWTVHRSSVTACRASFSSGVGFSYFFFFFPLSPFRGGSASPLSRTSVAGRERGGKKKTSPSRLDGNERRFAINRGFPRSSLPSRATVREVTALRASRPWRTSSRESKPPQKERGADRPSKGSNDDHGRTRRRAAEVVASALNVSERGRWCVAFRAFMCAIR